jgi:hypothetical protein
MKIGVSNLSGGGTNKEGWFYLIGNEANTYRVLPPLLSLADKGQFAKYYATHKIFYKDPAAGPEAKNKVYSFQCVEKKDRDSGLIKTHCPFCDKYGTQQAKYDEAQKQGLDKDQLKAFLYNEVLPYRPEKQFYVNAVNQENKVSILPLKIKSFKALQDRLKEVHDNYAIDATGMKGIFFNFRKTQKYKGDRDTVYTVDPSMVQGLGADGVPSMSFNFHELTEEFINYLTNSARDLSELFKTIDMEDISALAAADSSNMKVLLDRIFSRAEKEAVSTDGMTTTIPGTSATAVARMTMTSEGPATVSPSVVAAPVAAAAPAAAPVQQAAAAVPATGMSDDDWFNQFNPDGK